MKRLLPLLVLAAGCASPPPAPEPEATKRVHMKILYVLEDGGVFRYDEIAMTPEVPCRREVRTERDDTFTRYSFTLHAEGGAHWWTSL